MNTGLPEADITLDQRVEEALPSMSPAEQKMASFFRSQKAAVLLGSAADIAQQAGTSDATVVRTARSLGFDGLSSLRAAILADLTTGGPEARLKQTLEDLNENPDGILSHVLEEHRESLQVMESAEFADAFRHAVQLVFAAPRRFVFGIGPSGSVADYVCLQFNRLGLPTTALSDSGVALADGLLTARKGDVIVMIAYAPVYREISVVLDYAEEHELTVVLIGDSLAPFVRKRVAEVLPVPRGRADHLSMHGATIVLIEAMIVALAAQDRDAAFASLKKLGELRGAIDKAWLKRGVKR
ncbi:MurR/RpiR family transcriptional regulator [Rhizobium sp. 2MFCol3.1]|uniref:MurR/RpiR family transcriptional regulator n=1 Tax=Rhizobium sp. 2MFCol3.1 TaxID=1246459 RepID=UPI0003817A2C|nr:MurR/RpiR family transcriptional regulator [Rhizobium sp. 2MFCol3.1]